MVLNALVGSAGLAPTLAALQSGKTLALANKESPRRRRRARDGSRQGRARAAAAGGLGARRAGAWPCAASVARTSSAWSSPARAARSAAGPATSSPRPSVKEALAHPVWTMGPKITIDSATLMNKGLEVIEAHYLFDLDYSQIHVVIHPEGDGARDRGVPRRQRCARRWPSPT